MSKQVVVILLLKSQMIRWLLKRQGFQLADVTEEDGYAFSESPKIIREKIFWIVKIYQP